MYHETCSFHSLKVTTNLLQSTHEQEHLQSTFKSKESPQMWGPCIVLFTPSCDLESQIWNTSTIRLNVILKM